MNDMRSPYGTVKYHVDPGRHNVERSEEDNEGDFEDDLPGDTLNESKNKYLATRKRSVLCCRSDTECLRQITVNIARGSQHSGSTLAFLRDLNKAFTFCQNALSESEMPGTVFTKYPTACELAHAGEKTVQVTFADIKRLSYNSVNFFDGADTGIFAATGRSIYIGDILDFRL